MAETKLFFARWFANIRQNGRLFSHLSWLDRVRLSLTQAQIGMPRKV